MESTPFLIFCGIIYQHQFRAGDHLRSGQSGDHFQSGDYLRAGIMCGPVQTSNHHSESTLMSLQCLRLPYNQSPLCHRLFEFNHDHLVRGCLHK